MDAMTSSGGAVEPSPTSRSSRPTGCWPAGEGIFCEPASAASVAGLLAHGARRRPPDRVRAHRPRPQGPADGARAGAARVVACDPELGGDRAGGARMTLRRRRLVRVPALLGQPRPRLRRAGRGARAAPRGRGAGDRELRGRTPSSTSRATAPTSWCAAFERLHPADAFEFRIASEIPLSGGLGSSAAAIVAGLLAADHLFELDADVLGAGDRARGAPRQRRRGAGGRLRRSAPGTRVHRFEPPMGLEAVLVVPHEPVGPQQARAALPAQRPARRRGVQRRPGGDADPRAGRGRLGADRRRAARPPAPALPRPPVPALGRAARARGRSSGRWARRSPAPGPSVLVWCRYEQTGPVVDALARETAGWARVMRAPFESQGADVRGL